MEWSWLSFIVGAILGGIASVVIAAVAFFKDMDLFPA